MNKALFLDRDGTIIFDKNYLSDPSQVELIPGAAEGLRIARDLGYLMFLFTNQSGIGRHYFTMEDVLRVNQRMMELIGLQHPVFAGTCIAPETSDEPQVYRKPSPKFILEMVRQHNLDPRQSYIVGDANSDVMAGVNAGIQSVGLAGSRLQLQELPHAVAEKLPVYQSLLDFVTHLKSGSA